MKWVSDRARVLHLLSRYFGVEIEAITSRWSLQTADMARTREVFRKVRPRVEARWCWWYWLESRDLTAAEIADLESVDRATVAYALKHKYLVLERDVERIIYGTNL